MVCVSLAGSSHAGCVPGNRGGMRKEGAYIPSQACHVPALGFECMSVWVDRWLALETYTNTLDTPATPGERGLALLCCPVS